MACPTGTTNSDPSTSAQEMWISIHVCSSDTNTTSLKVPKDISVVDLLGRIAALAQAAPHSIRLFRAPTAETQDKWVDCRELRGRVDEDPDTAVALEVDPLLVSDGATLLVVGGSGVPEGIRGLWKEIPATIEELNSDIWMHAVVTLEAARANLQDWQAQEFVTKHLSKIVGLFLAQDPEEICPHEHSKACIQISLSLAAEIIAMDLQNQQFNSAASAYTLVEILGQLFDLHQYYVNQLPDVYFEYGEVFSTNGGFINLANYMANRVGRDSFPSPRVVASVLDFIADSLPVGDGYMLDSLQARSAAVAIAKASIDHLVNCSESYLQKISHSVVKELRRSLLMAVKNKSITTAIDESAFWDVWSALILRMIHHNSPQTTRKVGWAGWHDFMEWSAETVYTNKQPLVVSDAGKTFVNGVYSPTRLNRRLVYTRTVPDGFGDMSGTTLTCLSCKMRSGKEHWFISQADREQPGTDLDVDYYINKAGDSFQETPPLDGWIDCPPGQEDTGPPGQEDTGKPSLSFLGGPGLVVKEAESLPPFKFCNWLQENGILRMADSDYAYRELIAEATDILGMYDDGTNGGPTNIHMWDLLALLQYGMSDDAKQLELLSDARFEEIVGQLKTCQMETDRALKEFKKLNSTRLYERGLAAFTGIVGDILIHKEEKYRRIMVDNRHFQHKLGGADGCNRLMKAAGFQLYTTSGVEFYVHDGSVFSLLSVVNSLIERST